MNTFSTSLLIGAAATSLAVSGLGLLFFSWKRRLKPRWLLLPAGWALLLSAFVVRVPTAGYEFGISLHADLPVVVGLAYHRREP